ncbi:methyltransferase [Dictyobacter alpinus]|uniref:Methyltransferase n=1 Tax=Dictyobacter alpinus TaxID=2014873 RepID=A0A402BKG1_9CHLR|nr:MgtC/SapB family protein [Dictyobacter alpinus]GCE31822.1 methyltransferase [Dictyobacter alpinus]
MITFPEILLRMVASLVLGGLIGWEREYSEHNTGIRTNALISLGTTMFTIISGYAFHDLTQIPHVQLDPTRIASYIIAGIGFLGGGSIYFRQDIQKVKGLTTAASVWVVAAIGMACGVGFLLEAAITTIMALIVLIAMRYLEAAVLPYKNRHVHSITINSDSDAEGTLIGSIYDILDELQINVISMDIHSKAGEGEVRLRTLRIECYCDDKRVMAQAIDKLHVLKGVISVNTSVRKNVSD